jgi:hypothetical protein
MSWCLMYFQTFSIVGLLLGMSAQHALMKFQCVSFMESSRGRFGLLPFTSSIKTWPSRTK